MAKNDKQISITKDEVAQMMSNAYHQGFQKGKSSSSCERITVIKEIMGDDYDIDCCGIDWNEIEDEY